MNNEIPFIPRAALPTVDVEDVAQAHVNACFKEGIKGERILLFQREVPLTEVAEVLSKEFGGFGYRFPTRTVGRCPVRIASWFDPAMKQMVPLIGTTSHFDNTKSKTLLGIEYSKDLKETITEMGYSIIDQGLVQDKRKK